MGKKGSWFSAIKRVFTPHSKEKLAHDSEKKSKNAEKKKGVVKSRHGGGESNSLIPLFREPSSIEKIFRDFEREQQRIEYGSAVPTPTERPTTPSFDAAPPRASSPRALTPRGGSPPRVAPPPPPPRAASPRASSPRVAQQCRKEINYRPEPTLRNHHASATRIQAAYRGYVGRRSFRALKSLVRLQAVIRGQNVKRQTVNAMKQMQLLVRIQSQIQSQRIQMFENKARSQRNNDKDAESPFGKWTPSQASEAGNNEDWDDSVITKEEIEARLQRKMEAEIKRERAMAYAYSRQFGKGTTKSVHAAQTEFRSGGFPRWWSWLEHQPPASNPPQKAEIQTLNSFLLAPPTPQSEPRRTPRFFHSSNNNQKQNHFSNYNNPENLTPKSTRSTIVTSTRPLAATPPSMRTPQANGRSFSRYNRPTTRGFDSPFDVPLKDDDSLTSCPPFSAPRYMAPTVSANAKVRAGSNPKERIPGTPSSESKRRLSFPLTQGFASFKWKKGSLFENKDSSSQRDLDKNQSLQSIGHLNVDSTVSLPAGVRWKPFNRFV